MSLFLLLFFNGSIVFELLNSVLFILGNEVFGSLLISSVSGSMLTKFLLDDLDSALVGNSKLLCFVLLLLEN
jgi:hypothetical protein